MSAVPPSSQTRVRDSRDQVMVMDQIARGVRDENKLADSVFYAHHPEWKGKWLRYGPQNLKREWVQIRDTIVRPLLNRQPAPQPLRPTTVQPFPQPKTQLSSKPVPSPPSQAKTQAGKNWLQYNTFDNIRRYRPWLYPDVINTQNGYQKVSLFLPWYQKITIAVQGVSISLAEHGIGNLVFSINTRYLTDLVEDEGLRNKVLEMAAGGLSELVFTENVIEILGLAFNLLEIARGIENERMLGGFGPAADKWRYNKKLEFVFGIMAEDLSRRNWGDGYFFSRHVRDLANELAARFAEFQPIYYKLGRYVSLEETLAKYQGNIPDFVPPEPPVMRAR